MIENFLWLHGNSPPCHKTSTAEHSRTTSIALMFLRIRYFMAVIYDITELEWFPWKLAKFRNLSMLLEILRRCCIRKTPKMEIIYNIFYGFQELYHRFLRSKEATPIGSKAERNVWIWELIVQKEILLQLIIKVWMSDIGVVVVLNVGSSWTWSELESRRRMKALSDATRKSSTIKLIIVVWHLCLREWMDGPERHPVLELILAEYWNSRQYLKIIACGTLTWWTGK